MDAQEDFPNSYWRIILTLEDLAPHCLRASMLFCARGRNISREYRWISARVSWHQTAQFRFPSSARRGLPGNWSRFDHCRCHHYWANSICRGTRNPSAVTTSCPSKFTARGHVNRHCEDETISLERGDARSVAKCVTERYQAGLNYQFETWKRYRTIFAAQQPLICLHSHTRVV